MTYPFKKEHDMNDTLIGIVVITGILLVMLISWLAAEMPPAAASSKPKPDALEMLQIIRTLD